MKEIIITIENRKASTDENVYIINGNSGIKASFVFDSEWDDVGTKTARFIDSVGVTYDVILINDSCDVPVFYDTERIKIGVFAGDIITSTFAEVKCEPCVTDYATSVTPSVSKEAYTMLCELIDARVPQNKVAGQVLVTGENGVNCWRDDNGIGEKGDDYVLTEEDKAEIAAEVALVSVAKNQGSANVGKILAVGTDGNIILVDMPEGGASGDVIGTLDESNNILLTGNLADGTYTLKYENANGTYTEIGNLVVSSIANHAIVTNLENCTSSGSTSIRANGSATVTVIANSGYALPDSITVSGASYTWDKSTGNIVLSNPTSDVYVTVTAVKAKTNFLEPNTTNTTDWAIWCNDSRIGSDGTYRSSTTQDTTNYIPVQNGDIIHINQGRIINSQIIGFYNSSKAKVTAGATTDLTNNGHIADATALSSTTLDAQFTITNASVAYIRFTLLRSSFSVGDDEIIVNIERNGEYL